MNKITEQKGNAGGCHHTLPADSEMKLIMNPSCYRSIIRSHLLNLLRFLDRCPVTMATGRLAVMAWHCLPDFQDDQEDERDDSQKKLNFLHPQATKSYFCRGIYKTHKFPKSKYNLCLIHRRSMPTGIVEKR